MASLSPRICPGVYIPIVATRCWSCVESAWHARRAGRPVHFACTNFQGSYRPESSYLEKPHQPGRMVEYAQIIHYGTAHQGPRDRRIMSLQAATRTLDAGKES